MFTVSALPTVTVSKVSNGGTGIFSFSGSNGFGSDSVTTTAAGTAATGNTKTLTAASTATTITETPGVGYVLASATCTNMGNGGTATLSGNTLTLDAAATATGSNITCTFTNTKTPTVKISKTSNGGTGTYNFTLTGLNNTTDAVTTATSGTAVTSGQTNTGTVGTAVTLTETAASAGSYTTSATCTDANSATTGNAAINASGTAITIPAANMKAGAAWTCAYTNTAPAVDLAIVKSGTTSTTVGSAGSYSLTVWNKGPNAVNSSTVTDNVNASFLSGVTWTCTINGSASCGSTTSGSGNSISVTTGSLPVNASATAPTSGSFLTFTISGLATTAGTYSNTGAVAAPGGFIDTDSSNNSSTVSNITVGAAPAAPPATCSVGTPVNLLATTSQVYANNASGGSKPSGASAYASGFAFDDNKSYTQPVALIANAANYMLGTGAGGQFIVDLRWGWSNGNPEVSTPATFTLQVNGTSYAVLTTTNGSGTVGSVAGQNGAVVSQTVVNANGVFSNPVTRSYVILPASVTSVSSINMAYVNSTTGGTSGDDVAYNFDSLYACPPTVKLAKTSTGGTGTFNFNTITNAQTYTSSNALSATPSQDSVTTSTAGTAATSSNTLAITSAPGSSAVTLTEAATAGYTLASAACTDANNAGTFGTLAGNVLTIPDTSIKGNSKITCTFTNTAVADLAIDKTGSTSTVLGSAASYTIKVWNKGPSAITGATIADAVPTDLTTVSWTCTASGTATCGTSSGSGNAISFTSGLLPVNASATAPTSGDYLTITVTGTASSIPAGGSLTNTATVTAPAGVTDSTPGNNSSSQITVITNPSLTCSTTMYGLFGDFTNGFNRIASLTPAGAVGSTIATVPVGKQNYSLGVSADGSRFFVGADDSTLRIYDVATSTWSSVTIPGAPGSTYRIAVNKATAGAPGGTGYLSVGTKFWSFLTTSPYTVTALPDLTYTDISGLSPAPTVTGSGDFFADDAGNLYLSVNNSTNTVDTFKIRPGNSSVAFLGRITDAIVNPSDFYAGFAAIGTQIYGGTFGGQVIQYDLAALTATQTAAALASRGVSDLASCLYPTLQPTLNAAKTVSKVAGSAGGTVRPGDTLEYTIIVRNTGTIAAPGITFQDGIPANTTYVAGTTTLNTVAVADASGVMPFVAARAIGSPGAGNGLLLVDATPLVTTDREATIKFRVTVNASALSLTLSNQGSATYVGDTSNVSVPTDDPSLPGTSDPTLTPVVVNTPSLSITKTHTGNFITTQPHDYTLTVTNTASTVTSGAVLVSDALPTGLSFVKVTANVAGVFVSSPAAGATGTVSWSFTPTIALAQNASVIFTLTVKTAVGTSAGSVTNYAAVSGAGDLFATPAPGSGCTDAAHCASDPTPVVTAVVAPELVKRVRNLNVPPSAFGVTGSGNPKDVLEYCITFNNVGSNVPLKNFVVKDDVPANVDVSASLNNYGAGKDIKLTRGGTATAGSFTVMGGTTTAISNTNADAAGGSLTTTGGLGQGTVTVTLPTDLAAGEAGQVCFQGQIR